MKLLTTLIATATISLASVSAANSTEITSATLVSADNTTTTKLCMSAASGSRVSLLSAIKQSGYSRDFIASNLACNDMPVSDFIAKYGKSPEKMDAMLNRGRDKGQVTIKDVVAP